MKFKRGTIIKNKETGRKICVFKSDKDYPEEYEFYSDTPHDDNDFSYICTNHNYCRCCQ